MHLELREDTLGVVPRRMGADPELPRNRLVGPPLSQQSRYLYLTPGEAKASGQAPVLRAVRGRGEPWAVLLLQVPSELAELVNRAMQRLHQGLMVTAQVRKRRKEISQFIRRNWRRQGPACKCVRRVLVHYKPQLRWSLTLPMVSIPPG